MAFGAGGGSPDEIKGDINVTPLVDVCLVLLIIFMVVTPMLQQGVDVLLPEGEHSVKKPGKETDLIISVKRDGSVFVGQDWIPDKTSRATSRRSTTRTGGAPWPSRPTSGSTSARCAW